MHINGKSAKGDCRVWLNKLDRKDGSFIIRYKNYEICYNFHINILVNGKNILGLPPFKWPGNIYKY